MSKDIVTHYLINEDTMALKSALSSEYETIVIEKDRKVYIRQSQMEIIEETCKEGGADYNGRRNAVIHTTQVAHNVPIPVIPAYFIYGFPTHAVKHVKCMWIFICHIKAVVKDSQNSSHCYVIFKNGDKLHVEASYHTIRNQWKRTSLCIVRS